MQEENDHFKSRDGMGLENQNNPRSVSCGPFGMFSNPQGFGV